MNIIVLTPIRLLGEGLASCIDLWPNMKAIAVVDSLDALRELLSTWLPEVVLVDVTQGLEQIDIRDLVVTWPNTCFVALGIKEVRQEVIKCGRSGFAGYISRDMSVEGMCRALVDIVEGRQLLSPELSSSILRALFRSNQVAEVSTNAPVLTRREREVLDLLGRGLSNKEIGKELCLSVATVKHHVHHILEKLGLTGRAEAMRAVRDRPWLGMAQANQAS